MIEGVMMPFIGTDSRGKFVPMFMSKADAETMVANFPDQNVLFEIKELPTVLTFCLLSVECRGSIIDRNTAYDHWHQNPRE